MNSLSWLIYFADVLPSFARMLGILSCIGLIAAVVYFFAGEFMIADAYGPESQHYQSGLRVRAFGIKLSVILLMLLSFGILVPSRDTIYAIAVSETGEKILQSEWGKRGGRAIEAWITKQLEESSSKFSK